ncbi:MAG: TRAP transporter fused permease subunit [Rhodospirillaceae bacterium]|jgi:TRAP transporter 4TM/12TM fusion protein|nr:TRAP transporter fused permease subunit [Rhodospirillaceae bacterium]MBT7268314.1 TRAP transporter fused permease subunit [Rhodospirillaceae bacterium]
MKRSNILVGLTTIIALYHIVVVAQLPTWLGMFVPHEVHLGISILFALILIYLLLPAGGKRHGEDTEADDGFRRVPWYDWLLMASSIAGAGFVVFFHESILDYGEYGYLDTKGIIFASMLAIPVLEAVRRTTGWALPTIIVIMVLITIFQKYLPGLLYGRGYPLDRLLYSTYVGNAGIFGLPLGIAANIVIVYLIFGALMDRAGASRWFMDMALALTGWSRGGPAKAAVLASAMFGSISGSPSGNSATTGVFTIPMMKKIGYTPAFAAAVEAVASTGGMILPPVMGAIAFLMAEWLEVSYASIVVAAAVPALLYFLIIFVSVHLQAHKDGIQAMRREELPDFLPSFIRGWYYLIPMGALVYFLVVMSLPPGMAGFYTCGVVIVVSFLSKDRENWLLPKKLVAAFDEGVRRWITVASITAAVGIMIGALELSGVGIKVSRFIIDLAGGDLTLTLLLVGIVSLIVGMGLDATPAYVTLATLMAPALIRLGVPDISAHLFVIYWGLASFFTPPTCIAIFVTAGIANSKIWASGWEGVKLGIAAFVIPFAFVYSPALLLNGTLAEIIPAVTTAVIGASLVAAGIRGYLFGHLNSVQRIILFVGGLSLIAPGLTWPLMGLGISIVALVPNLLALRAAKI